MPKTTLTLSLRPKKFVEFIWNKHIVTILQNIINTGEIPSGVIISGIRGVGKTSLARIFARAINCTSLTPELEACGECPSCLSSLSDRHPDIIEMDGASKGNLEDIKSLIELAMMSPTLSQYKVIIIDEAHNLARSVASFEVLLKILEEPPAHVIWVFCTTQPNKIPETIKSRLLGLPLRIVPTAIISDYLYHLLTACLSLDPELIKGIPDVIARASNNSIRDALTLLEKIKSYCDTAGWSVPNVLSLVNSIDLATLDSILNNIASYDSVSLWGTFSDLIEEGQEAEHLYETMCQIMSSMLSLNLNADVDSVEIYKKYQQAIPLNRLLYLSNLLLKKNDIVRQATNKKLVLQTLSLELCV
jgi:DNA polymerase III subunit gamma/tau